MNKIKIILIASTLEALLVLCVGCANLLLKPIYYFCFYNVLYGILFSFLVPFSYYGKRQMYSTSLGLRHLGKSKFLF